MNKSKIRVDFQYLETLSQTGIADLTENLWDEDDVRQLCIEYELETGSEESMRDGLKKHYASSVPRGQSSLPRREHMLAITDLWSLIDLARTSVSDMSRKRQTLYEWRDCPDRTFNIDILVGSQVLRRTFNARIEAASKSMRSVRGADGQSLHEWQDIYDRIEDQQNLTCSMSVEVDEFVRVRDYEEAKKEQARRERLDDACAPVVRSSSMPKTVHERLAGRYAGEKIYDLDKGTYRIAKKWENVRG